MDAYGPSWADGDAEDALASFLLARLDEDEAAARAATQGGWRADGEDIVLVSDDPHWNGTCIANASGYDGDHIARHDPVRVLREVAAKRAILRDYQDCAEAAEYAGEIMRAARDAYARSLMHLSAAWIGHADYRQEWAPGAAD